MIDGYKELTPVIYGENAIKYLYTEQKKAEGEICFLLHWHDRMELTYVTEGTLRFVTEGEEFLVSAGELAVAGPGQMHGGFALLFDLPYSIRHPRISYNVPMAVSELLLSFPLSLPASSPTRRSSSPETSFPEIFSTKVSSPFPRERKYFSDAAVPL